IDAELHRDGGLAGLMHTLLTFDLNSVDVYTPPKTAALLEQKEESLPPHAQWWLETLTRGTFRYPTENEDRPRGATDETNSWPAEIAKHLIWESYALWMRQHNVRSRVLPDSTLHSWLTGAAPGIKTSRPRGTIARQRQLTLPDLPACRTAFDTYVGQARTWPPVD